MEDKIENKLDLAAKIAQLVKRKKKYFILLFFLIIAGAVFISFFNYSQESKNKKIAEKYIQAGIYLNLNDKKQSKKIYKEIIFSKNKFYSILSLNAILDNNLEDDNNEILKLFSTIEKINLHKEQINLVKIKKGLYLKNILNDEEGNRFLKEIITKNSIWKNLAEEISK